MTDRSLTTCWVSLYLASLDACHGMQHLARLVNHAELQSFGSRRYDGESWFGTAKYGTFYRVYFAAERTAGVGHVVDVAAFDTYMLEIVDVAADVHVHMMTAQDGVYTLLHVLALYFIFRRFGVDRMVSHYDDPVFLGGSQYSVQPLQLVIDVLLAGIGVFVVLLAVFVN